MGLRQERGAIHYNHFTIPIYMKRIRAFDYASQPCYHAVIILNLTKGYKHLLRS